ncbi:MAG TPA: asparagine synthase (glutamine-hydrolyzing) [Gemmatimonadales bacterium]|nr:asparagine synthase (glutamine-hydrolyzing) [Gemmatimonadales bacterium]
MCGIAGIAFSTRSRRVVDPQTLVRMRDTMTHRGPDDCGVYSDGRVGLAHRRLSIIDVAGGHQPMSDDTGSLHIVYNGEIYNHPELKVSLERRGHRYRTRCDTETILRLYQDEGPRAVELLRGMFAFAIWDSRREELSLARDRLGEKPLYYVRTNDGSLYFASEIKALLAAGAVSPTLNYEALPDYLANHAPSGVDTLFVGVKRLPPGHTLRWRDGLLEVQPYWDLSFRRDDANRSDQDLVAEFGERFTEAVRMRLMSDVPLGVFLSGGIDSASIAATMSRLVMEPIKTFSVGFVEREANELRYARAVARAYGTDHHEVVVSADEFLDVLPTLVWHEDEPLGHAGSVPLYFVARLARDHVKVVLTGEGSDELLAGYGRYARTLYNVRLGTQYHRVIPALLRRAVRRGIERLGAGSSAGRKLQHSFLCVPPDLGSIYFDNFAVFPRALQAELLTPEARERAAGADPYRGAREQLDRTDARTLLDRLLYVDTKTYLHELLMKQDQMSMAASIESRVPFLDHELVEFAAGLPVRLKLRGSTTKRILRESMKGVLPPEILARPKMGFPVPVSAWFRGRWRGVLTELVLGERARRRGIFDPDVIGRLIAEHATGQVDHMERLWALMNFELWQRVFVDGEEDVRLSEAECVAGQSLA